MLFLWILLGTVAFLLLAVLIISYICFYLAFYASRKKPLSEDGWDMPAGRIYIPYRDYMRKCAEEVRAMPCKEFQITAHDGLTLYGRYFEYAPGAPVEIMMHGYRGSAERDLSGGVNRAFQLGHSVLLVDQRCSGKSGGHVITFGIREHRDCLLWVEKLRQELGAEVRIILTGVSMGAATVIIAAGQPLPENVIGVLADCGYTSAKEIIKIVIKAKKLPPALAYPFVRLGALLYGGFNLEKTSPLEAVKNCKVPLLFIHGQADAFIPWTMSQEMCNACPAKTKLVLIPGAGHGLSYPVSPELYLKEMRDFFYS